MKQNNLAKLLFAAAIISLPANYAFAKSTAKIPLKMQGNFMQSGVIIGKTTPNASISFGELSKTPITTKADKNGNFILGLDRDAASPYEIKISVNGKTLSQKINVYKRLYKETVVNGLPPAKVNPPETAAQRITAESIIKKNAWKSNDYEMNGFMEQFRWPVDKLRITSPWGAVRRLNGELQRPHYGVDTGAPTGTPLYAPSSGIIILSEPNMYFEGGIVAIDHGQGLISYTMHMSKIDVSNGQKVKKGDKIGEVGASGRANGPHMHWSLKWRGQQLDPELMTRPLSPFAKNNIYRDKVK